MFFKLTKFREIWLNCMRMLGMQIAFYFASFLSKMSFLKNLVNLNTGINLNSRLCNKTIVISISTTKFYKSCALMTFSGVFLTAQDFFKHPV